MTQRNAKATLAAPRRPHSHSACSPESDEGGDGEEVKLEGPVSALNFSSSSLPPVSPWGTLLHGTDTH